MEDKVLDSSLIKDLSNHIYEKRKATAFQIESFTKAALSKEDTQTIFKIIRELTELTNNGTNSAKMGAITALGSVSVALGSIFIAFFLDEIVKPIFATFRDTDARVRYYACESLYNIAKIARGEILLYFNEVFDILCILVTDTESSVKNAADILDRLIKDIVSAKSTNYVSILQQPKAENETLNIPSHIIDPKSGDAFQVNQVQDTKMAFSLPKFIPTLLERMYTIDPFAKKFLISWLELFDDIPALELITFLPNILEPLLKFLSNNAPSDVRIETQNVLNTFLKEIKGIQKVKIEVKRKALLKEKENEERKRIEEGKKSVPPSISSTSVEGEAKNDKEKVLEESTIEDGNIDGVLSDLDNISIKSNSTAIVKKDYQQQHQEIQNTEEDYDVDGDIFVNGQDIFIDYPKIIDILLSFIRFPTGKPGEKINDTSNENHETYLEILFTVLKWLQEILDINPTSFIKLFPDCVAITLKNIEISDKNSDFDLRNHFLKFNLDLQGFLFDLNEANKAREKIVEREKNSNVKEGDKGAEEKKEDKLDTSVPVSVSSSSTESKPKAAEVKLSLDDSFLTSDASLKGINSEMYDEFTEFQLNKTLQTIMNECFTSSNELSRITSLDWLIFLYSTNPSSFFEEIDGEGKTKIDLTALLRSSTDSSNEVILKVLQLLSKISETNQDFFKSFMVELITFFEKEISENESISFVHPQYHPQQVHSQSSLTRDKIEFIIRKLCVTLDSEKIFKTLAEVLIKMNNFNLDFLYMITVTLNNILLTTQELTRFRKKLKNLDFYKIEDWTLFATLFESWCHNAPSALSLCLLTSNYELAFLIIKNLSESEINFQLLTQLDILVQLLESPIFVKLRLQLLEPEKNPYLYKTLYGLLMILPQSSTFTSLKNRLSSVSHVNNLQSANSSIGQSNLVLGSAPATPGSTTSTAVSIKRKRIYEMLDKFTKIQESHELYHQNAQHLSRGIGNAAYSSTSDRDKDNNGSKDTGKHRESKKDRLVSYDNSGKKEYFGNAAEGKRKPSGRFALSRFN
ncbi:vacuole morphology and inheritance protein 14 [[Candida] railenensis]|uniref:Vacuole morphology and inheritance protein 14 n=1 Tax=[Candida] railenensis TaxID=45579 RepID=A0A9P0QPM0_9ASCO|nr:vacuole morphology and inheritance protein 14 [[Candida] railenensis]